MKTMNCNSPIHFACLDSFGNFWHFRNMWSSSDSSPFLISGRIEATPKNKLSCYERIYNKTTILKIKIR